jgi:hypothetical protein
VNVQTQPDGIDYDLARYAGIGGLFVCAAFIVGLIVACFVPPQWAVSADDAAFLQSNPHGVIDLVDDYQKQLDGRPMSAERHAALKHLRQLWVGYWLRWGVISFLFGAIVTGVGRTRGSRAAATLVALSAAGFVLFLVLYLLSHPGFDPFN